MATPAVRNLVREGKSHQIYNAMQAGAKFGMQSMDQALADLVKGGIISRSRGRRALRQCRRPSSPYRRRRLKPSCASPIH